jgi:hypothetical protein
VLGRRSLTARRDALAQELATLGAPEEFLVTMHDTWENAREIGRAESCADAVLIVLQVRGIAVPAAARRRILAEKDPSD